MLSLTIILLYCLFAHCSHSGLQQPQRLNMHPGCPPYLLVAPSHPSVHTPPHIKRGPEGIFPTPSASRPEQVHHLRTTLSLPFVHSPALLPRPTPCPHSPNYLSSHLDKAPKDRSPSPFRMRVDLPLCDATRIGNPIRPPNPTRCSPLRRRIHNICLPQS